jgi:hypothetical protein
MTSKYNSAGRFFLILAFISAVAIGTAAAQPGGRLFVFRSPNFGWNLAFNLEIDGRPVGDVVRGRHYQAWLPAGQHVLTVHKVPYVGYVAPTSTVVNIQPGWTYVFTAMYDSQLIFLHPAGAWLTPGAIWQNLGKL